MPLRKLLIAIVLVLLLLAALGAGVFYLSLHTEEGELLTMETGRKALYSLLSGKEQDRVEDSLRLTGVGDPPPITTSFLTGTTVSDAEAEKFLGVMIDLAPAARPLFRGLDQAKVLFEMPAEGGVPRILAIFSSQDLPEEIGPVRSARDYFVKLAESIAGGYVHAGGSPDALEMLYTTPMTNYDEYGDGFVRDSNLARPHNLFITPSEIIESVQPSTAKEAIFLYSQALPTAPLGESAQRVDVDISTRRHAIAWNYDVDQNCYVREQQLEEMAFCPQNVTVLATDIGLVPEDDKGRLDARIVGTGEGILFREGLAYRVAWQREGGGMFHFVDPQTDTEVPLLPGQTFFQVIDTIEKVAFSSPG